MKIVNPHFIYNLLNPLIGSIDDDLFYARYGGIDGNDSEQVKSLITEVLLPYFNQLEECNKQKVIDALQYSLSKADFPFGRVLSSRMPGFLPPDDVRDFFLWTWDVLTEGREFHTLPLSEMNVQQDIDEAFAAQIRGDAA